MPNHPNTCGGCDATWTGTRPCHCAACHNTFSGLQHFDRHRYANHGCIDPATIPGIEYRNGMWRGPQNNPWTTP